MHQCKKSQTNDARHAPNSYWRCNKSKTAPHFPKTQSVATALYYIQKFGFEEHHEYKKIDQKKDLEHLLGKINFVLQINPKDAEFIKYKALLFDLKHKQDLKTIENELFPI